MINSQKQNKMQRHEPIIQLSDHVKNKIKQHKCSRSASPFINSSDEFIEIQSVDDEDEDENDSLNYAPSENSPRSRRDTYTTYDVKQSSGAFFTDGKSYPNDNISHLEEKYKNQKNKCQECLRRERLLYIERENLLHLYDQNKYLTQQLRSSILLNHRYKDDIDKLKTYLNQVNSHLYKYQLNYDHLKQQILSNKKINSKISEEHEEQQDDTIDHIKRLQYEIQMYNRLVASKEKQQQQEIIEQKQRRFLL